MEFLAAYLIISAAISGALASDPDPLQDFCVADYASGISVNGHACKPAANVTADDFFFDGLANAPITNNSFGHAIHHATVEKVPGLNTLGISLARVEIAPGGQVPPRTHPRATEVVFVLDGVMDATIITTSNRIISKTLKKGDVFVLPIGIIHFFKNNDQDNPAAYLAALNSQLPGTQVITADLFKL